MLRVAKMPDWMIQIPAGHGVGGDPAQDLVVGGGDEPVAGQFGGGELRPGRFPPSR